MQRYTPVPSRRCSPGAYALLHAVRKTHGNRCSRHDCRCSISDGPKAAAATCRVRQGLPADVPRLAAIEALCAEFSAHWDASEIEAELGRDISHVLVAADPSSDEALGYIVGWLIAGEMQVLELAVDPVHQGRGIGSVLLGSLMAHSTEAVLEVKAHNTRAIQLYKRQGFEATGLRRKYYADGSDALLMSRSFK